MKFKQVSSISTRPHNSRWDPTREDDQTRARVRTLVFVWSQLNRTFTRGPHAWTSRHARVVLLVCSSISFLSAFSEFLLFCFARFRHRHVPKAIFKAAKEKKVMMASVKRKYVLFSILIRISQMSENVPSCSEDCSTRPCIKNYRVRKFLYFGRIFLFQMMLMSQPARENLFLEKIVQVYDNLDKAVFSSV